jgi:hypothetical protein
MAVYQIARIQVRRGQANQGTGIPQLASGEIAWAIDAQELYIGNGSVSEGAPAVGNTRLLTLNDLKVEGNLLAITQYAYKQGDNTIVTGSNAGSPVFRAIQDRLDDQIISKDFGMSADGITDDTVALQLAIDQLFLNPNNYSYTSTTSSANARVTLVLQPGYYNITSTIYIPSYATIVGAGIDKTIITYNPPSGDTSSLFQFVNDTSTPTVRSTISSTQYTNQPRNISISNLTITMTAGSNTGLQLDAVKMSNFENIAIAGNTTNQTIYNTHSIGIAMNAFSSMVTCEENTFKNIQFLSVTTAVNAKQDIINNSFLDCTVTDSIQGFVFGAGSDGGSIGQQYGPRQTLISNIKFYKVKHQAVYIERGDHNSVINCKFNDVGNNSAGNAFAAYPQIFFKPTGNSVENNQSDRGDDLAVSNLTTPYVPAIAGNVVYKSFSLRQITLSQANSQLAFRLPMATYSNGVPSGSITYTVDYLYKSTANAGLFTRKGVLEISADIDYKHLQLSDDYEFAGTDVSDNTSPLLSFSAKFLDASGNLYTGATGQVLSNVAVYYNNTLYNDVGRFNYSYSVISYFNIG